MPHLLSKIRVAIILICFVISFLSCGGGGGSSSPSDGGNVDSSTSNFFVNSENVIIDDTNTNLIVYGNGETIEISGFQLVAEVVENSTRKDYADLVTFLQERKAAIIGQIPALNILQIEASRLDDIIHIVEDLKGLSYIDDAYPNMTVYQNQSYDNPINADGNWWIEKINLKEAWEVFYNKATIGSPNVKIGFVDTSIHPEYFDKLDDNQDRITNINSGNYTDLKGVSHGTIVAELASADSPWIVGVAPDSPVISYNYKFNVISACLGIFHCINHGADIVNLSLGEESTDSIDKARRIRWGLKQAIRYAYLTGTIVVLSSGNIHEVEDNELFPINEPEWHKSIYMDYFKTNVIIVTGLKDNTNFNEIAYHYGNVVDIAAPGINVSCIDPAADDLTECSGTSFSAPIVSGAVALMWSLNPDLSPLKIKEILKKSGKSIDNYPDYPTKSLDLLSALTDSDVGGKLPNTQIWYKDSDSDGYSDGTKLLSPSRPGSDYFLQSELSVKGDCNDQNYNIHPGAEELCSDGIDQNCNGSDLPCDPNQIDNDSDGYTENQGDCDDSNAVLSPATVWYKDNDSDGYSDGATNTQCLRPAGFKLPSELTSSSGDCRDSDNKSYPGANEICGDGIDQNCNGSDLLCDPRDVDNDNDGYTENQGDCDDSNAALNPATTWYKDSDNDGYSDGSAQTQCQRPTGFKLSSELTSTSGDCRDTDNISYPGAQEICGDGIDQNCNGSDTICSPNDIDNDSDGYTENQGDCDDSNVVLNPGTVWYKDSDSDGYSDGATKMQCLRPAGFKLPSELTSSSGDCRDSDNKSYPGATEICGDGIDQNCNGSDLLCDPRDVDNDNDGYTENQGDCDDSNVVLNPSTVWYKDSDNDGYSDGSTKTQCQSLTGYKLASNLNATSGDCRDNDNQSYPGANEVCGDTIDQNCNGQVDETCPVISINTVTLDFGSDQSEITFQITNSGGGTIHWTISENEPWLGCYSPSGDTSGDGSYSGTGVETIYVNVGRNGLADGDYTSEVSISSDGGDTTIQIKMKVETIPQLTEISFVDIGTIYGIDVSGSVACVTDGRLRVIDVSDPYNATLTSTVDTPDSAQGGVKIKGSYAYVADFYNAVTIVDISDIENPTMLGYESSNYGAAHYGIDVIGSYAFVGTEKYSGLNTEHAYLQVIDISYPANPQTVYTIDLERSHGPDVQIVDNILYLSTVGAGVHWIYDVRDPASPTPVANYPNIGFPSIFVNQSHAYFTSSYNNPSSGLLINDISNPYNPIRVGDVGTPTGTRCLCLRRFRLHCRSTNRCHNNQC